MVGFSHTHTWRRERSSQWVCVEMSEVSLSQRSPPISSSYSTGCEVSVMGTEWWGSVMDLSSCVHAVQYLQSPVVSTSYSSHCLSRFILLSRVRRDRQLHYLKVYLSQVIQTNIDHGSVFWNCGNREFEALRGIHQVYMDLIFKRRERFTF